MGGFTSSVEFTTFSAVGECEDCGFGRGVHLERCGLFDDPKVAATQAGRM